jgi:predicted flap endonuclease-1-like 5' DNA nuclease
MLGLALKAALLLVLTFIIFAWFGWNIAGLGARKRYATPDVKLAGLAGMAPDKVELATRNVDDTQKPTLLTRPQGAIDDLKLISGIGPANERELYQLGIFHFWQIAEWTPENILWVSDHIRFPKRIVRENWVAQAIKLMPKN